MTVIDTLIERNADFADHRFNPRLPLATALGLTVIGCLDPRVDPAYVLGLQPGDAAVIRNIGGRVTPATLESLSLISTLPRRLGAPPSAQGMHVVVLQHTNCGITLMAQFPPRNEALVKGHSDRTWITHWCILRDHPAVLAGPDPRTLIDPIDPDDLHRAMADLADGWLSALQRSPESLQHRGPLTYTVLTLCRMLYTLRWGVAPSKPQAARWTQQVQEGRWSPLIERALAWRKAPAPQDPVSDDERRAALALLEYTLDQCRSLGRSSTQPEP